MNIKVEALENNQVKFSFEVDADDVDARIKRTYRQVAKRYSFPGFRPGKAPRPVIDNIMGADAVRTTVTGGSCQRGISSGTRREQHRASAAS